MPMKPVITQKISYDCSSINIKKSFFFKKPNDYNPIFFWIVTAQDWSKTSSANVVRPLRTLNFLNVIDRHFVSQNIKNKCCVFDNQRVKLAKTANVLFFDLKCSVLQLI